MKLVRLCLAFLGLIIVMTSFSLWKTQAAFKNLQNLKLPEASQAAKQAWLTPKFFSSITFRQLPIIELWRLGLESIPQLEKSLAISTEYSQELFSAETTTQTTQLELKNSLQGLQTNFHQLRQELDQAPLLKEKFEKESKQLALADETFTGLIELLTGQQSYFLLFQNSEELRATGGFLGSYAELRLNDGQLEKLEVQDIYVPDGQFTGFVEAPPGAQEYLSGGRGLRLPDANWHPDFPTSAQRILSYFAFARQQNIDGVIAVNLPVVEKILAITGPVEISDYETLITPNNVADVARADRENFFPGSQQKRHFLSLFLKQLLLKLESLTADEQLDILRLLATQAENKNLLFYSRQPQIQQIFTQLKIAGQLRQTGELAMMLVESNVGINKANQHIIRAVDFQFNQRAGELKIEFTNLNPSTTQINDSPDAANHLNYVNYQRLILPPSVEVEQILVGTNQLTTWDERTITNSTGQDYKEVGFLVVVPTQNSQKVKLNLSWPELSSEPEILIQKQPGLPPTNYRLIFQENEKSFALDQDLIIKFDH